MRKPRRKKKHGNMPAPPRLAATVYPMGHEVRVYETATGRYYPVVAGARPTRHQMHTTMREAVAEGRALVEAMTTTRAAYSRAASRAVRPRRRR